MDTSCNTITSERRRIAEKQRRAGVMLADWLRMLSTGNHEPETIAFIQRYIDKNIERIEDYTARLLELDRQIAEKTPGMSEAMRQSIIESGDIF